MGEALAVSTGPVYFEDVEVGDELPPVERPPLTLTWLVMYCGAAGVYDPIHFDPPFAQASGFPDVVANGSLRVAFLGELVSRWALPEGHVRRLACRHRGYVMRGDRVMSGGRVVGKSDEGGVPTVECEIWNEIEGKGRVDLGSATIELARRPG